MNRGVLIIKSDNWNSFMNFVGQMEKIAKKFRLVETEFIVELDQDDRKHNND